MSTGVLTISIIQPAKQIVLDDIRVSEGTKIRARLVNLKRKMKLSREYTEAIITQVKMVLLAPTQAKVVT